MDLLSAANVAQLQSNTDITDVDVSSIETLTNLISKYGPVIVVLSVFLFLFLIVILFLLKSFLDTQSKTTSSNEALMKSILNNFESIIKIEEERKKENSKDYDEKDIVKIFVKLNKTFKLDCRKYCEKVNADRVGIYVFHNGTTSSHGLPFFKVSCISEWISHGCGITTHLQDCSAVPLAMFDDIIERVYSYGFVIVDNHYNNDNNSNNYTYIQSNSFYLEKDKAKTAIFCAVYDSYDNILAFVLAEYVNRVEAEAIDDYITELKEFCARIRPALEFSDYNSIGKDGDD